MSHLTVADQITRKKEHEMRALKRLTVDVLRQGPGKRLTQRTVKFIRWLKNHLDLERDWDEAMAKLSQIHQHS